jgi:hypothetical protein
MEPKFMFRFRMMERFRPMAEERMKTMLCFEIVFFIFFALASLFSIGNPRINDPCLLITIIFLVGTFFSLIAYPTLEVFFRSFIFHLTQKEAEEYS